MCSGIEAASVAWHPLGWTPVAFSEVGAFPRAVLEERWPHIPLHGDFTTIKGDEYGPIDLLVGGTPCQSFSVAGLRGGLADDRGNLALEFLRLAQRARPRWVVWENVPGVLSSAGGRDFGSILGGLAELGYGFAYRVLDAQYIRVDGYARAVPQRRRRVFVVGHLGDWRRAAAVLFEREGLSGHPAPRREAGQTAPGAIGARTGRSVGAQDADCGHMIAEVAPTLDAHYGDKMGLENQHINAGGGGCSLPRTAKSLTASTQRYDSETETLLAVGGSFDVSHTLLGKSNDSHDDTLQTYVADVASPIVAGISKGSGNNDGKKGSPQNLVLQPVAFTSKDYGGDAGEIAPTLRGMGHDESHANGGGQVAVAFAHQQGGSVDLHTAADVGLTVQRNQTQAVHHAMAVRRLTPRECERLMGFPDDYTLVPYRGKDAADGPRYKSLGNSMAVNCMRWIGRRIAAVEAIP